MKENATQQAINSELKQKLGLLEQSTGLSSETIEIQVKYKSPTRQESSSQESDEISNKTHS